MEVIDTLSTVTLQDCPDEVPERARAQAEARYAKALEQALGQVGHADESLAEGDYPDKARTGDGSGLVLCVPKQSPQNAVHL